MAGATKRLLAETPMLVNQLAGVDSHRSTLGPETKMLIIMMMAEPVEAEVVEGVEALRTKVEIVLNLRAASSVEKKATFQENALILVEEAAAEVLLEEEVLASSASRRVTWLVIVPTARQAATTTLRVEVVAEEELKAAVEVSVSSARERATLLEIALTTMAMAMLSLTSDRGEMMMVALSAEEVATTTMLHPLAMLIGATTTLHLPRTGVPLTTITLMPKQMLGEILTPPPTTTRRQMTLGAPTTTMTVPAVAGTETILTKLNLFISM